MQTWIKFRLFFMLFFSLCPYIAFPQAELGTSPSNATPPKSPATTVSAPSGVTSATTNILPNIKTDTSTPLTITADVLPDNLFGNTKKRTYTISKINGTNGFMLRGASASAFFYIPILDEWDLESVDFHLDLNYAALFGKAVTLTIYANDNPISTVSLKGTENTHTGWDIKLPASLAKGNLIALKFVSIANDYGFSCYNLSNPLYWIYVSGKSTVTYNYQDVKYCSQLAKFPYPFVNTLAIEKDKVILVYPKNPTINNFTPAFYISNVLSHLASWRGLSIITTMTDQLSDEQKQSSNIIFVGTTKQLDLNNINANWPLKIDAEGLVFDKDNHKISDDIGILMITRSPWNPMRAVLVVTGTSDIAVQKAAQKLRSPDFSNSILFNEYALVDEMPEVEFTKTDWTDTTLKDLNFDNQSIYANGDASISYDINLPLDQTITGMDLYVDYATSPFLSQKQASYLTLKVNDVPTSGTTINPINANIARWKYHIDARNLKQGTNHLTFAFDLKLGNQHCTPQDAALAWATIYSSTRLVLDVDAVKPYLDFKIFNQSVDNLTIAIPKGETFFNSSSFLQSLTDFSTILPNVTSVKFVAADKLVDADVNQQDFIYIGDIADSSLVNDHQADFPFSLSSKKFTINPDLLPYLSISHEKPMALAEVMNSPFAMNHFMMIISALSDSGYKLGFDLLTDPKRKSMINGDAVLAYENGTFTSVQSKQLELEGRNKRHIGNIGHYLYVILILIGSLVVLIAIAMYAGKRLRKFFSKSKLK